MKRQFAGWFVVIALLSFVCAINAVHEDEEKQNKYERPDRYLLASRVRRVTEPTAGATVHIDFPLSNFFATGCVRFARS